MNALLGSASPVALAFPAGAEITVGQLVLLKDNGRVYPVSNFTTDFTYARALSGDGLSLAKGRVWGGAYTGHGFNQYQERYYVQNAAVRQSDGYSYRAFTGGFDSSYGYNPLNLYLAGNTAEGTPIASPLVSSTPDIFSPQVKVLSNGNVVVVWAEQQAMYLSNGNLYYAIYNGTTMAVVTARTLIEGSVGGPVNGFPPTSHQVIALSGGGFMVIYNTTAGVVKGIVYSNTGTVVTAATVLFAPSGAAGGIAHSVAELSNGNFAIAISHTFATNPGTYFLIVSPTLASVVASTQISPDNPNTSYYQQVNVVSLGASGFAVLFYSNSSSSMMYRVYSNAGAAAFAAFSLAYNGGGPQYIANPGLIYNGTGLFIFDGSNRLRQLGIGAGSITTIITLNNGGGGGALPITTPRAFTWLNDRWVVYAIGSGYFYHATIDPTGVVLGGGQSSQVFLSTYSTHNVAPVVVNYPTTVLGGSAVLFDGVGTNSNHGYAYSGAHIHGEMAILGVANESQAVIGNDVEINVGAYEGPIAPLAGVPNVGVGFAHDNLGGASGSNGASNGMVHGNAGILFPTNAKLRGVYGPNVRIPQNFYIYHTETTTGHFGYRVPAGYRLVVTTMTGSNAQLRVNGVGTIQLGFSTNFYTGGPISALHFNGGDYLDATGAAYINMSGYLEPM